MAQGAEKWRPVADRYARQYGVPTDLVMSVIQAESGGRANAKSPAGALGVMQLMPGTARGLGVADPLNAEQNIQGGTKMLGQLLHQYKGNTAKAVAAYNAGAGAVNKYNGVPPYAETQAYVKRVLGGLGSGGGSTPVSTMSSSSLAASVALGAAPAASPFTSLQQSALNRIFADDPSIMSSLATLRAPAAPAAAAPDAMPTATGAPLNMPAGEPVWRYLQKMGQQVAGLKNDPGDSQTTGGHHVVGSNHYKGEAIDFGDGRNSPEQLRAFAAWARQNASQIKELYYNPLGWGIKNGRVIKGLTAEGHDNHLHIAM